MMRPLGDHRKCNRRQTPIAWVEVANVDHIAGRIANLDPIAYAIRLPDEEVNPTDEAGHRCLNGETGDDRNDPDGDKSGVPVHKKD